MSTQNQRQFGRYPSFGEEIVLETDGDSITGNVLDESIGGIAVEVPRTCSLKNPKNRNANPINSKYCEGFSRSHSPKTPAHTISIVEI